jgi:arsenite-transporting ATPase
MAFQETVDLVNACKRLKIAVPVLFLNLATPPSDCPLCLSIRQTESALIDKFRQTFSDMNQPLIFRRQEPVGIQSLRELGKAIYYQRVIDYAGLCAK